MISMKFGAVYAVADGFFVGRFIGEDALAAINLIIPIIMAVFVFSNMVATGSSVRISVFLGEGKREAASRVFSFSVKFIFLISCILSLLGLIFAEPFVRLISPNASELAIRYGTEYLSVYAVFSALLPIFFATDNYLRVCEKEKLSMSIGITTQLLNIALDVILIAFLGVWLMPLVACSASATFTLALAAGKKSRGCSKSQPQKEEKSRDKSTGFPCFCLGFVV